MRRLLVALSATALGFVIGASATAWAHGPHGHGKSTAGQCMRILDGDVQLECLRCLQRADRAFFPGASGEARCTQAHRHRVGT